VVSPYDHITLLLSACFERRRPQHLGSVRRQQFATLPAVCAAVASLIARRSLDQALITSTS
jgi:hypothetical protein